MRHAALAYRFASNSGRGLNRTYIATSSHHLIILYQQSSPSLAGRSNHGSDSELNSPVAGNLLRYPFPMASSVRLPMTLLDSVNPTEASVPPPAISRRRSK